LVGAPYIDDVHGSGVAEQGASAATGGGLIVGGSSQSCLDSRFSPLYIVRRLPLVLDISSFSSSIDFYLK
jgi:hypothetical protein